jgi:N-dimethylarginine dimethylaminohydrolase
VDSVRKLPDGVVLEGAGDCVFDNSRNMFWLGYGQRSDVCAQRAVEDFFTVDVTPLELADPRFYHMDTALSPLPRGEVMYVPEAFTAAGLATIHARVPRSKRIEVGIADAEKLAANAVCLGDTLIMAGCGERLFATLEERGYRVVTTPLRSFLRSGGAAFCLTLRLDRRSQPGTATAQAAVA